MKYTAPNFILHFFFMLKQVFLIIQLYRRAIPVKVISISIYLSWFETIYI